MYFDYGNYGNLGKPGPFEGVTRGGRTERADDALPVMSYSAPVFNFSAKNKVNQNIGLSQRGSALAQVSAFAAGLPVQTAETTQRVSANFLNYLEVYPYV